MEHRENQFQNQNTLPTSVPDNLHSTPTRPIENFFVSNNLWKDLQVPTLFTILPLYIYITNTPYAGLCEPATSEQARPQ